MSFILGYFKQKVVKKFNENLKTPFWAIFVHFKAKKEFFWKICFFHFLLLSLLPCRISEKTNKQIPRSVGHKRTDRGADKNEFMVPPPPPKKKTHSNYGRGEPTIPDKQDLNIKRCIIQHVSTNFTEFFSCNFEVNIYFIHTAKILTNKFQPKL